MSTTMPEDNELSEREREILRLVATGASNKEIAYTLVISPNTVKVHLRNIFAKVGVASRTEATLYAIRTGLLPAPSALSAGEAKIEPAPQTGPEETSFAADALPGQNGIESNGSIPGRRRVVYAALLLAFIALIAAAAGWLRGQTGQPVAVASTVTPALLSTRWSALPALPAPIQDLAGAIYAEQIFVTAGETGGQPSARTWRFERATQTWTPCPDKLTPVSQARAALLGEKIYVPGGRDASGQPVSVVEVYDPRAGSWAQAAPLPQPRSGYALAALEGRLYLFGGWDGQKVVDSVFAYDPQQDLWETRASLPGARAFAGAAVTGGKILILGGWDGSAALDRVEAYYPSRDRPGETPWEALENLPQARSGSGAAVIAEAVYLLGGAGEPEAGLPGPAQWSPQTGKWSSFDSPPQPAGERPLLLALDMHLHALAGTQHQAYQAIYNLAFPVIQ